MSRWRTGRVDRRPPARVRPRDHTRDDQRHVQRGLVGEHAVRRFAVLAQALAVVGGDDDQRRPRERRSAARTAGRARGRRRRLRRSTAVRRMARNSSAACRGSAGRRRAPSRRTAAVVSPIQSDRTRHDDVGAALGHRDGADALHLGHLVVVDVEARASGRTAWSAESRRRRRRWRSPAALSRVASVAVPACTRKPLLSRMPCSYGSRPVRMRGVRGQGDDGMGVGEREPRTVAGQPIEVRRLRRRRRTTDSASARSVSMVTSRTFCGRHRVRARTRATALPPGATRLRPTRTSDDATASHDGPVVGSRGAGGRAGADGSRAGGSTAAVDLTSRPEMIMPPRGMAGSVPRSTGDMSGTRQASRPRKAPRASRTGLDRCRLIGLRWSLDARRLRAGARLRASSTGTIRRTSPRIRTSPAA